MEFSVWILLRKEEEEYVVFPILQKNYENHETEDYEIDGIIAWELRSGIWSESRRTAGVPDSRGEREREREWDFEGRMSLGPLDHCVNNVYLKDTWMNVDRCLSISVSVRVSHWNPSIGWKVSDLDRYFGIRHVTDLTWIFLYKMTYQKRKNRKVI